MLNSSLQQRLEELFSAENEAISLATAIDFYLSQARITSSTRRVYAQSLKLLIEAFGEEQTLGLITRHMMADFSEWLSDDRILYNNHSNRPVINRSYSAATVKKHYGHIYTFFEWCSSEPLEVVREGRVIDLYLISRNPMKRLPRPSIPPSPPKAIAVNDYLAMVEAAQTYYPRNARIEDRPLYPARNTAILMYMASTGCRSEGVRKTTISQITWLDDGAKVWVWEKGRNQQKKGAFVFLYPSATVALMEWLELHPNPTASAPIFCKIHSPHTGGEMKQRALYKMCETIAKKAGVTGRINPHSFRHRAIMEWLKANGDLSKASQLARHSDVRVTARHYARWTSDELYQTHQDTEWF